MFSIRASNPGAVAQSSRRRGGSRGIGKEFCRQLLSRGCSVVSTSRQGNEAQMGDIDNGNLHPLAMDVTAPHSVAQCVDEIKRLDLAGDGFDFVVVCSGTRWVTEQGYGVEPDITTVSAEHMLEAFKVNAIGPLLVTQNLVKAGLLKNPSLIANITSKMGSVMDNTSGGVYPYRSSKSALNIISKSIAVDLKDKGVKCIVLHPGWVRTEMTGGNGLIDVDECVSGLISVIETKDADPDVWYDFAGRVIPW